MQVLDVQLGLLPEPVRRLPLVLFRVPVVFETQVPRQLEVRDEPPGAAEEVAGEERDEDELEQLEAARVYDRLGALEVLEELEHSRELRKLAHPQETQHTVHARRIAPTVLLDVAVRVGWVDAHENEVEREGAEDIDEKSAVQHVVFRHLPGIVDEEALEDKARAKVEDDVDDEPNVDGEVEPEP